MGDKTGIEWTDATWNPVTGCTEVSPGCDHCYAKTFAERWRGTSGHYFEHGFDVQLRPDKLDLPIRWRRPRSIFVNSMSDLFHDAVPDEYIVRVFAVMKTASQHTFQVLTKRHARMRSLLSSEDFRESVFAWSGIAQHQPSGRLEHYRTWPLSNVWLGVSAENQQWADIRIPALLDTPAAVRWISAEPLLGPIGLKPEWLTPPMRACFTLGYEPTAADARALAVIGRAAVRRLAADEGSPAPAFLDWVVVGGESGHGARPMQPDWARSLRDQCTDAGMPFLFKQWGEWAPEPIPAPLSDGTIIGFRRVGKRSAGRQLDGQTWDQYPEAVS